MDDDDGNGDFDDDNDHENGNEDEDDDEDEVEIEVEDEDENEDEDEVEEEDEDDLVNAGGDGDDGVGRRDGEGDFEGEDEMSADADDSDKEEDDTKASIDAAEQWCDADVSEMREESMRGVGDEGQMERQVDGMDDSSEGKTSNLTSTSARDETTWSGTSIGSAPMAPLSPVAVDSSLIDEDWGFESNVSSTPSVPPTTSSPFDADDGWDKSKSPEPLSVSSPSTASLLDDDWGEATRNSSAVFASLSPSKPSLSFGNLDDEWSDFAPSTATSQTSPASSPPPGNQKSTSVSFDGWGDEW